MGLTYWTMRGEAVVMTSEPAAASTADLGTLVRESPADLRQAAGHAEHR